MLSTDIKKRSDDRLRNTFPIDDFDYFANDIVTALEAFENFTKSVALFSNVICGRLRIRFDGNEIIEVRDEYDEDDRGMIQ